MKLKTQKPTSK